MRIQAQKNGSLTESERYELARLLIKAGYVVYVGKEKASTKQNAPYVPYIEYAAPGQRIIEEIKNGKEKQFDDA